MRFHRLDKAVTPPSGTDDSEKSFSDTASLYVCAIGYTLAAAWG
ncbi:hypothetical protein HMPREF3207_04207 [Citrobacter koseri]|nr:hypothetical protein HMPREF3207_04207 [Citrobacter koseri]